MALGGILVGVALGAKELLVLGREGLVHQGALALEALKAFLMPVTVLVGKILQKEQYSCSCSLLGLVCMHFFILYLLPWCYSQ